MSAKEELDPNVAEKKQSNIAVKEDKKEEPQKKI